MVMDSYPGEKLPFKFEFGVNLLRQLQRCYRKYIQIPERNFDRSMTQFLVVGDLRNHGVNDFLNTSHSSSSLKPLLV